jgi:hypothetical protein
LTSDKLKKYPRLGAKDYTKKWLLMGAKEQFMDASIGCESVTHLIRNRSEADPSLVVGKVDCKNAFNEIHKEPILDVIRDELPVLLPFAELLLSIAPIHTIYHNTRTEDTIVHSMK